WWLIAARTRPRDTVSELREPYASFAVPEDALTCASNIPHDHYDSQRARLGRMRCVSPQSSPLAEGDDGCGRWRMVALRRFLRKTVLYGARHPRDPLPVAAGTDGRRPCIPMNNDKGRRGGPFGASAANTWAVIAGVITLLTFLGSMFNWWSNFSPGSQ